MQKIEEIFVCLPNRERAKRRDLAPLAKIFAHPRPGNRSTVERFGSTGRAAAVNVPRWLGQNFAESESCPAMDAAFCDDPLRAGFAHVTLFDLDCHDAGAAGRPVRFGLFGQRVAALAFRIGGLDLFIAEITEELLHPLHLAQRISRATSSTDRAREVNRLLQYCTIHKISWRLATFETVPISVQGRTAGRLFLSG